MDLGDDGFGQLFLSLLHALLCQLLLLLSVVEDGRHVLARGTASRVVVVPEHLEHRGVVCLSGIKHNLHRLRVVSTEGKMKPKTASVQGKYNGVLFLWRRQGWR